MMLATRRTLVAAATNVALMAAVVVLPAGVGLAADPLAIPTLPYELDAMAPAEQATSAKPLPALSTPALSAAVDAEDQRCMAKVVHHEARNQSHAGMIAVAETLMNRLKAGGRFGRSICAVANQRGQYFDTSSYRPREDSADWHTAMDVAEEAMSGKAGQIVEGALFFRAAYAPATTFFRTRERIAAVGDHIFYR